MTDRPRRAYRLSIEIGGDEWPHVVETLREMLYHAERAQVKEGSQLLQISASPSYGGIATVFWDSSITHTTYFRDMQRYLLEQELQERT